MDNLHLALLLLSYALGIVSIILLGRWIINKKTPEMTAQEEERVDQAIKRERIKTIHNLGKKRLKDLNL